MTLLPDKDLLAVLAATGAPEPLDELIVRYWGESYRIALRCLNDADAARELVYESFAHLALGVPALTPEETFRSWLHGSLLKRLRLNESQAPRRPAPARPAGAGPKPAWPKPAAPEPAEDESAQDEGASDASPPPARASSVSAVEAAIEAADAEPLTLEDLRRLVSELPLEERLALILGHYEGCEPAEVAAALQCTVSVARSRLEEGLEQVNQRAREQGLRAPGPQALAALMAEAPNPIAPAPPAASTLVDEDVSGPGRARALLIGAIVFAALLIGGALSILTGDAGEDAWAPSSPTAPAVVLAPTLTPSAVPSPTGSALPAPSGEARPDPDSSPEALGGELQCWLRYEDGQAASGYLLYAQPAGPAATSAGPGFLRWEADTAGLVAPAAPAGRYRVRLHPAARAEVLAELEVGQVATRAEVVVPRRLPLRGVVSDERGVPLGEASVWLFDEPEVRTGPDGRFELGEQPLGSVPLSVRAEGFRQVDQEWVEHDGSELRLTLHEGRVLTVQGELGAGVSGAGFVGYVVTLDGQRRAGTAPVVEGRFRIGLSDLPPATEVSLAIRPGEASAPTRVSLNSDQGQVDLGLLDFLPARSLRGQVVTPDGQAVPTGQGMARVHDGLFDPAAVIGADGAFEVRGLGSHPAELELTVVGDDVWASYLYAVVPLDAATIEGGDLGLVELALREPDALRVTRAGASALRRAGLDPSDLVIGVDGLSTANAMLEALAQAAQARRPALAQLLRDGVDQPLELTLDDWNEDRLREAFAPAIRR